VLKDSEFQIVLNGNPLSRQKVENGDFCLRVDQNKVDLNRNWDEMWNGDGTGDSYPGTKPFTEPETRIFKRLVTAYKPQTFLTVHSGTKGLYMPWAYDKTHMAQYNHDNMNDILTTLNTDHCQCPWGAAGKEVGYPCPGTCLDYVYAILSTPFSFAFEIYVDHGMDADLQRRFEDKVANGGGVLLEKGHHLGHPHFRDVFDKYGSDFVGTNSLTQKGYESDTMDASNFDCFGYFNPHTEDDFNTTVKNWAEAYIQMTSAIAKKINAGEVPAPTTAIELETKTGVYYPGRHR